MSKNVPVSRTLPANADLAQLKKQAKELAAAVRRGDAEALQRVQKVPRGRMRARANARGFALNEAQRVVAREYGFSSWAKLKQHVIAGGGADCDTLPLLPLVRVVPFPGVELAAWVDRGIPELCAALARDPRVFCVARRDAKAPAPNTIDALYRIGVVARVREWREITAYGRPTLRLQFCGSARAELREVIERDGYPTARTQRLSRARAGAPERVRAGADRVRRQLELLAELSGDRGRITRAAVPADADAGCLLAIGADLCELPVRQWLLATLDPARQLERLGAALDEIVERARRARSQEGDQAPPSLPAAPACLVVLAAPQQLHLCGRHFALTAAVTSIGRNHDSDIALLSDTLSRRHCAIEHRDGRFVLLDRGSTNGCFANDDPARIDRRPLEHGDRIALGDTIMAFLCGEQMETELPALLDHLAEHDAMTELFNERAWSQALARALLGARGRAESLSVLLVDVDGLQRVNTRYGGLAGNGMIRAVASTLRDALEAGTLLARLGANRYAIALPGAARADALAVGERMRAAVAASRHVIDGSELQATVSVGCAELAATAGAEELMDEASAALRLAKQRGGNCVSSSASEAA